MGDRRRVPLDRMTLTLTHKLEFAMLLFFITLMVTAVSFYLYQ